MRNDPQNPGSNPKSQAPGQQQEHERGTTNQGSPAKGAQGKDDKASKSKTSPTRADERDPGRSH